MSSSWKTTPCVSVFSWSVYMVSSFNYSDAKNELLDFLFKRFSICNHINISILELQLQHTSQSATEAPGFHAAWWWKFSASPARTPEEISWYVITFEQEVSGNGAFGCCLSHFSCFLRPLNKNAFFPYKFDINQHAVLGYTFCRKSHCSLETNFASTLLLLPYHIILFHQEQCFYSDVDVKESFTYHCTRDEVYTQNENSNLDRETFQPLGWLWQETFFVTRCRCYLSVWYWKF